MTVQKTVLASDPAWLKRAFTFLGLKEGPGTIDNPTVVEFYADAGSPGIRHDSVAWCAAFVGAMLVRSGLPSSSSLAARSYLDWGKPSNGERGDIVIFKRGSGWQGHVAFVLGIEKGYVWHLGGNQSDAVTVARTPKTKVLGYRKPVTLTNSRTIGGQALIGAGSLSGAGGSLGSNDHIQTIASGLGEAGYVFQTLTEISPWLYLLGGILVVGGIGLTVYARYSDWMDKGR